MKGSVVRGWVQEKLYKLTWAKPVTGWLLLLYTIEMLQWINCAWALAPGDCRNNSCWAKYVFIGESTQHPPLSTASTGLELFKHFLITNKWRPNVDQNHWDLKIKQLEMVRKDNMNRNIDSSSQSVRPNSNELLCGLFLTRQTLFPLNASAKLTQCGKR